MWDLRHTLTQCYRLTATNFWRKFNRTARRHKLAKNLKSPATAAEILFYLYNDPSFERYGFLIEWSMFCGAVARKCHVVTNGVRDVYVTQVCAQTEWRPSDLCVDVACNIANGLYAVIRPEVKDAMLMWDGRSSIDCDSPSSSRRIPHVISSQKSRRSSEITGCR